VPSAGGPVIGKVAAWGVATTLARGHDPTVPWRWNRSLAPRQVFLAKGRSVDIALRLTD
jgi:hypothetical protein